MEKNTNEFHIHDGIFLLLYFIRYYAQLTATLVSL